MGSYGGRLVSLTASVCAGGPRSRPPRERRVVVGSQSVPRVSIAPGTLTSFGAAELAGLIRRGEVSAREVVDAHIERIEAVDPRLNAVVFPLFERARVDAEAADAAQRRGQELGPLHGVPMTIKDQHLVDGTPTTLGLPSRAAHRAQADGPCVARLRRAGAIFLGKTNVGQLLISNECENPLYGRTVSPWDIERSPGGSSGGEAAIVAAGGSPLGLGADFGGSIRIPAHFSGVCGFMPTARRLTGRDTPQEYFAFQEAIVPQAGPLARHVADLALAMSVLAAPEDGDPTIAPVPWREPTSGVEGLRVGWYDDNGFIRASPAVRRAVHDAAAALATRGAIVEEWTPPDVAEAERTFMLLAVPDRFATMRRLTRNEPVDVRLKALLQLGALPAAAARLLGAVMARRGEKHVAWIMSEVFATPGSAKMYLRALEDRARYRDTFLASMAAQRLDALLCPPYALPALRHESEVGVGFWPASYAQMYNALGMPAGVVPVTRVRAGEESDRVPGRDRVERAASEVERNSAGLPIGVQVVARLWREDVALTVMAALEAELAGHDDVPRTPTP